MDNRKILGRLVGLSLLLNAASASAQMPMEYSTTNKFQRIEQPFGIKAGVAIGGIALVGLELWWFLGKPKPKRSTVKQGIQTLTIDVDGGYEPSQVVVKAGQPVQLNFFRKDPSSCLEKVLFPDFHIVADLAMNQITSIEFTPEKPGEYSFTCGMNMFRGVVKAE